MDRIGTVCMVDEAYDSLTTFSHFKCRTRGNSIVSNQAGLSKIRVDLLLEWMDVNLVVIDRWAVGERESPAVRSAIN